MHTALTFTEKLSRGELVLGTGITFADPLVTEALCADVDFVWIDMEHNGMSIESVQNHVLAARGTTATPLVRVPWNDPVRIKPVLDVGAAGVICPLVRTAEDVKLAVAACRYPPDGIRGFGPRVPTNYGRVGGPEYCQEANKRVITIVQIEHTETVDNLDEILAVPGLSAIVVGPNDLSGSLGHMANPGHPEVRSVIETIVDKACKAKVPVGIAMGDDFETLSGWFDKGVQWFLIGTDFGHLVGGCQRINNAMRDHAKSTA